MKITSPDPQRYWHQIAATIMFPRRGQQTGAPWPVVEQVAAMLNNEDVAASVTDFDGTGPSTWAVALITTGGRLIRVRMQFDAEQYDIERDKAAKDSVPTTVNESWSRRLSEVVGLDIANVRMRPTTMNRVLPDHLDVGGVSLTFRDRAVVELPIDQLKMTEYDERGQADHFLDVLRQHTGL